MDLLSRHTSLADDVGWEWQAGWLIIKEKVYVYFLREVAMEKRIIDIQLHWGTSSVMQQEQEAFLQ